MTVLREETGEEAAWRKQHPHVRTSPFDPPKSGIGFKVYHRTEGFVAKPRINADGTQDIMTLS